jgi:Fur family transcriptional regulator, iron response regulator
MPHESSPAERAYPSIASARVDGALRQPTELDRDCSLRRRLEALGLRATRQRLSLAKILFNYEDRHLTAEMLFEEALKTKQPISLATVYNTLGLFTDAGVLRHVAVDGSKTYYDTNVTAHQHFYVEDRRELLDIDEQMSVFDTFPNLPDGYEVSRVDIVVRLRRKKSIHCDAVAEITSSM